MSAATATDVRREVAARFGVRANTVVITQAVADGYNRRNPDRPYMGEVKGNDYRPSWAR